MKDLWCAVGSPRSLGAGCSSIVPLTSRGTCCHSTPTPSNLLGLAVLEGVDPSCQPLSDWWSRKTIPSPLNTVNAFFLPFISPSPILKQSSALWIELILLKSSENISQWLREMLTGPVWVLARASDSIASAGDDDEKKSGLFLENCWNVNRVQPRLENVDCIFTMPFIGYARLKS